METCVFCRIVEGNAPSSVVFRDSSCIAFLDIHPVNPGHLLVVPRAHVSRLSGLDEPLGAHLFSVAHRLAAAVRRSGVRAEGINLWLADGAAAGQEVDHVHVHVVPRFAGDGFGFRFGPENGRPVARERLDSVAASISAEVNRPGGATR